MSQFALPEGIASSAGVVDRDGVRLSYAVSGAGGDGVPTILLLPTWSIIPSRFWKAQVPYLSRHYRVVTFDGRGSGDSGRPEGAAAYTNAEYAADALAVLDATGTDRAVVVGLSCAGAWGVHLAADHPERVSGLLALGPACGFDLPSPLPRRLLVGRPLDVTRGWAKYNKYYWLEGDYDDFVRFFFSRDVHRAPLHQADRGLRRLGARDRPGDVGRHDGRPARRRRRGVRADRAVLRAGCSARSSSSTAPTTTSARTPTASGSPS